MFKHTVIFSLLLNSLGFLPNFSETNTNLNINPEYQEKAKALLKSLDHNNDQKLSPNEVNLSFRLKRFQYVDKNQDGYLDEAELIKSYSQSALAQSQREANLAKNNNNQKPLLDKIINKINAPTNINSQETVSQIKDSGLRYTVEPGDSLYGISQRYNVIQEDLIKINQIQNPGQLPINKVLVIPASQKK